MMEKIFTLFAAILMTFASHAGTLVVCEEDFESSHLNYMIPIRGNYTNIVGSMAQMIYPVDMLQDMVGHEITEVKFHTVAHWLETYGYSSEDPAIYINFSDATIQLSFMSVEGGFEGQPFNGATPVATVVPVKGDNHMTFVLDEPYVYEGGELLIECKVIVPGNNGEIMFLDIIHPMELKGAIIMEGRSGVRAFMYSCP